MTSVALSAFPSLFPFKSCALCVTRDHVLSPSCALLTSSSCFLQLYPSFLLRRTKHAHKFPRYSRQTATRRSILSAEGQSANGGHGQGKAAADGGTVVQRARRTKRAQPQQHGQTSTLQRSSDMPTMSRARYQSGNGLGARNDALGAKRGRSASSDPRLSLDRQETYSRYSVANSAKTVYGHWENNASTYNAGGSNRNEVRASKVQRISGGESLGRYQENMGAEQSGSRDAAYKNMTRDVRLYGARDVVNFGSLAVDGDTEQSWVIGGTNGKRNESCVPFLGARVRVSTKLGQGSVDSYFNATVAAYLPPTWGTGVGEQALWRVVFDHPCITPQDLDVDELLASAAMYTSFVRKRQSFEPVQRALPENVMAAAATAAGKFGVSSNGLPPSEAANDATGKGWGVGGLGSQNSLVKDMKGWAGTGGSSGRCRTFTCSDIFWGGSERDLPMGSIGDGGDEKSNGNIGCLPGMGGGAVDMLKLKDLDLEGMFILRVLPDHGEVVGEVTAQSNGGDTFEISYESGAVEQLNLKELATSLRATMVLSRKDGWGVSGSGLVRRITPSLAGVSAAQREFMTARAASAEAGKAGCSEKEIQPPKTVLGGSVATEEGVGVNDVNGILLRQERAALYVQMNDTVMCECNGSLLVGRVCQLKPGKAKVHVSGFKVKRSRSSHAKVLIGFDVFFSDCVATLDRHATTCGLILPALASCLFHVARQKVRLLTLRNT